MGKQFLEILLKNINLNGMFVDALDGVLEPALKKVVEDSANTWDDSLMALYPLLSEQVKKLVEEKLKELVDDLKEE